MIYYNIDYVYKNNNNNIYNLQDVLCGCEWRNPSFQYQLCLASRLTHFILRCLAWKLIHNLSHGALYRQLCYTYGLMKNFNSSISYFYCCNFCKIGFVLICNTVCVSELLSWCKILLCFDCLIVSVTVFVSRSINGWTLNSVIW